jgi:hypothetical protein
MTNKIFPECETLPARFMDEVRGLPESALDRRRPEKGWGGWSIREQVSHTAYIPYLVFLQIWGAALFGENIPAEVERADTGAADRMLDPRRFHRMEDILGALSEGFVLIRRIVDEHSPEALREKVLPRRIDPERTWASGESVREYFETLVLPAHSEGIWRDAEDPNLLHQTLECSVRHVFWEAWVHLKTVQLHKSAEGLPTGPPVPETGYVALLRWD